MKKDAKWRKIEMICAVTVIVFLAFLVNIFYQFETESERDAVYSLGSGWYQIRDGERLEIELPCAVMPDADGKVTIYNDTLSDADEGKVVSERGVQNHLEMRMGSQNLYCYKDNRFQKNKQMQGKLWADINLPDETGQEPLCLVFESEVGRPVYVQAPIIGEFPEILGKHIQESFFSILMVLGMLGLGIVSVVIFLYTRYRQIEEKRFLDVASFLILCALWCILDSGIYQMYGRQSAAGTLVSFYAFMLMSVPMLHFVQNTVKADVRWIPESWIFLFYGNAILQGIISVLFDIPFIQMLVVTHLILFTGVVSMIILLWIEYQKNRTQELALCLKAFGVLGVSGLMALVLYWMFTIYWYNAIFQFGILLYIIFLIWGLLCKVSNDIQFRLEQTVYARMSVEDRMTGLKNQKAFGQYMEKIKEASVLFENVLLLFIDIEELKNINDNYGMQMGDEAVIRTARSIQRAEHDMGEQNTEYFRVSGDEFAVVVTNPQKTPEEWECKIQGNLKKEIGSRYYVRLKFGYSYLRREDGTLNSVSNWKMQADTMLHSNIGESGEELYGL